jgi:hypothetical protein
VLVLKNYYQGGEEEFSFAKFFILNAKVVQETKFGVNENINIEWVAEEHGLLGVENKASRDAQFVFRSGCSYFSNYFACQLQNPAIAPCTRPPVHNFIKVSLHFIVCDKIERR